MWQSWRTGLRRPGRPSVHQSQDVGGEAENGADEIKGGLYGQVIEHRSLSGVGLG